MALEEQIQACEEFWKKSLALKSGSVKVLRIYLDNSYVTSLRDARVNVQISSPMDFFSKLEPSDFYLKYLRNKQQQLSKSNLHLSNDCYFDVSSKKYFLLKNAEYVGYTQEELEAILKVTPVSAIKSTAEKPLRPKSTAPRNEFPNSSLFGEGQQGPSEPRYFCASPTPGQPERVEVEQHPDAEKIRNFRKKLTDYQVDRSRRPSYSVKVFGIVVTAGYTEEGKRKVSQEVIDFLDINSNSFSVADFRRKFTEAAYPALYQGKLGEAISEGLASFESQTVEDGAFRI